MGKKSTVTIEFRPGSRVEQIAFMRAFGMNGSADALEQLQRMDDLCGADVARRLRGYGIRTPEQLLVEDEKLLAYIAQVSLNRVTQWRQSVTAEIAPSDAEIASSDNDLLSPDQEDR